MNANATTAFEAGIKVGDLVQANFTAAYRFFSAPAQVVKVNAKSFTVTLTNPVAEGTAYTQAAGTRINLPKFSNKLTGWSANNRIAPMEA